MYQRVCLFIAALMLTLSAMAQVTFTVQVPATGVMQKSQLWNVALVSASATPVSIQIRLTLLTRNDNATVMTASTPPILLTQGIKQLNYNQVSPVQYNYLSSIFNVDMNPNGFLPIGEFLACYSLMKTEGDVITPLGEECVPIDVQPLSPPLLNTPFDQDTLAIGYPYFTWLPPTPLQLFNQLSYDLLVVEVSPNQTVAQAIQQNLPLYVKGNLLEPLYAYPASAPVLDTNHLYAWRVIAKNNQQLAAQSEVWTFRVKNNQVDSPNLIKNNVYHKLQKSVGAGLEISKGILRIEYENRFSDTSVLCVLKNLDNVTRKEVPFYLHLKSGLNLIDVFLNNKIILKEKETYVFELVNSALETWQIKFTYTKN